MSIKINIGCGRSPTSGWINIDNSLSINLANSNIKYSLAKFFKLLNKDQIENIEWNKKNNIKYFDVKKKLPFNNLSVETIYTSHMIEHLHRTDAICFLKEAYRILKYEGILRISVPDLKIIINDYNINKDANKFMERLLVEAPKIKSFKDKLKLFISGYRHHQWMYDQNSLSNILKNIGFKKIIMCPAGETNIQNYQNLNLFERANESIYIESIK